MEVERNCCLLILHHWSLAVAQTNVPCTHTSINTTQDLSELCSERMRNWTQAVITVIIHYTLCVRSQRLVSEVDTGLIAFVSLQFWGKKWNVAERDTAHMTSSLSQVVNEQCRRCWSWRAVCWGRCRGASPWGAGGSLRLPLRTHRHSHTNLTGSPSGEFAPRTGTQRGQSPCFPKSVLLLIAIGCVDVFTFSHLSKQMAGWLSASRPVNHRPPRRPPGLYCIHSLEVTQFRHLAIALLKLTSVSNTAQRQAFVRIK